jgi:hypothetical protein
VCAWDGCLHVLSVCVCGNVTELSLTDSIVCIFFQEPDDQEATEDHDSSPPEDTALYPHNPAPATQFQQVTHTLYGTVPEFTECSY